jgi:hypothetical protein
MIQSDHGKQRVFLGKEMAELLNDYTLGKVGFLFYRMTGR